MARSLSGWLPAITVISLRELQRQIPERLHSVGAMVTGQARHLHGKARKSKKEENNRGEVRRNIFISTCDWEYIEIKYKCGAFHNIHWPTLSRASTSFVSGGVEASLRLLYGQDIWLQRQRSIQQQQQVPPCVLSLYKQRLISCPQANSLRFLHPHPPLRGAAV